MLLVFCLVLVWLIFYSQWHATSFNIFSSINNSRFRYPRNRLPLHRGRPQQHPREVRSLEQSRVLRQRRMAERKRRPKIVSPFSPNVFRYSTDHWTRRVACQVWVEVEEEEALAIGQPQRRPRHTRSKRPARLSTQVITQNFESEA